MDQNTPKKNRIRPLSLIAALLYVSICLACALGLALFLHRVPEGAGSGSAENSRDLAGGFEAAANNVKSGALDGLAYIRKIYQIPEGELSAPAPDPEGFGTCTDPAVIQGLIDGAAVLLDGQEMLWSPEIELFRGSSYHYYYDETILVVAWKEKIHGKCCTCAEIKIADGSQLRRKLAGDSYDSDLREYCSQLAAEANAVIATNGDFYVHRPYGVTVYQRQLYRCELDTLDNCFFTASGDMLLVPQGQLGSREEVEAYIRDNDVLFSAAFGPIVVQDGERRDVYGYRVGESGLSYSRSAIATVGELHYFLMTINYDFRVEVTANVRELAAILYEKGCQNAYALDGGQTAELWMNGTILNHVDWGAERQVSDILYFASALPRGKGD